MIEMSSVVAMLHDECFLCCSSYALHIFGGADFGGDEVRGRALC